MEPNAAMTFDRIKPTEFGSELSLYFRSRETRRWYGLMLATLPGHEARAEEGADRMPAGFSVVRDAVGFPYILIDLDARFAMLPDRPPLCPRCTCCRVECCDCDADGWHHTLLRGRSLHRPATLADALRIEVAAGVDAGPDSEEVFAAWVAPLGEEATCGNE